MIAFTQLEKIPLLASLTPETHQEIARRAFKTECRAGQTLLIEGNPAEFCYFLLSGDVRVVRMSIEGRVQVLARLSTGTPINIMSLLLEKRVNQASVETLTPITALALSAPDFDDLLERCHDFSIMLLRTFANRMAKITDLAAELSLYTVRARLAQFLIDLADKPSSQTGWTQDEIAAQIGTVRDMVGRLLRDFESQGLIKRDRQQIILLDRQRLNEEAGKQTP